MLMMENLCSEPEKHTNHYNKKKIYEAGCKGGESGSSEMPDTKNIVKNMISCKDRHVAIYKADRKDGIRGSNKKSGIKKSIKSIMSRDNRQVAINKAGYKGCGRGSAKKPGIKKSVKRISQHSDRRDAIIKAGRKGSPGSGFDEDFFIDFVMTGSGRKPNIEQSVKGAIPQNVRPVARPSPPEAPPPPDALDQ